MSNEHNSTTKQPSSILSVYMAYLLRYMPEYPITVEQLHKKAVAKRFLRLVVYLESLPPDHVYNNSQEALDQLIERIT